MPAMPTTSPPAREPFHAAPLVDQAATSGQRTYAQFMHLTLLGILLSVPPVIPPLVMWLVKRDGSHFIDDHGREAVNFQLSLVLYAIVTGLAGMLTCGIAFFAFPAVAILGVVGAVMAAMAAGRGEYYRYPATIRFIT